MMTKIEFLERRTFFGKNDIWAMAQDHSSWTITRMGAMLLKCRRFGDECCGWLADDKIDYLLSRPIPLERSKLLDILGLWETVFRLFCDRLTEHETSLLMLNTDTLEGLRRWLRERVRRPCLLIDAASITEGYIFMDPANEELCFKVLLEIREHCDGVC